MEWVVTFVLAWLMLVILVDKSRLHHTVWGGVIAVVLQLIVDTGASNLGLYTIVSKFHLGGGSPFFTFGAVFTMGVLFVQYVPTNPWLKITHILVISILFLALECLLEARSIIEYHHWHMGASWFTNILVFITITWSIENIKS